MNGFLAAVIAGTAGWMSAWFFTTGVEHDAIRLQLKLKPVFPFFKKRPAPLLTDVLPFADFFELFAMALSAGLVTHDAFVHAVSYLPASSAKRELGAAVRAIELGQSPEASLDFLMRRIADDQVKSVFILIRQSMKRGSPLAPLLRTQAEQLRNRLFRQLDKDAQTLGLKLLFPIIVFIFPTLFIILFGMIILQFNH